MTGGLLLTGMSSRGIVCAGWVSDGLGFGASGLIESEDDGEAGEKEEEEEEEEEEKGEENEKEKEEGGRALPLPGPFKKTQRVHMLLIRS